MKHTAMSCLSRGRALKGYPCVPCMRLVEGGKGVWPVHMTRLVGVAGCSPAHLHCTPAAPEGWLCATPATVTQRGTGEATPCVWCGLFPTLSNLCDSQHSCAGRHAGVYSVWRCHVFMALRAATHCYHWGGEGRGVCGCLQPCTSPSGCALKGPLRRLCPTRQYAWRRQWGSLCAPLATTHLPG